MVTEVAEGDGKKNFSLQSWLEQTRFEAQYYSRRAVVLVYVGILILVFYQIILTIAISVPGFQMPTFAWVIAIPIILLAVLAAANNIREEARVAQRYERLLNRIYLGELEVADIKEEYERVRKIPRKKWLQR